MSLNVITIVSLKNNILNCVKCWNLFRKYSRKYCKENMQILYLNIITIKHKYLIDIYTNKLAVLSFFFHACLLDWFIFLSNPLWSEKLWGFAAPRFSSSIELEIFKQANQQLEGFCCKKSKENWTKRKVKGIHNRKSLCQWFVYL